jgi:DNA-binding transcriptional LysR family regulator
MNVHHLELFYYVAKHGGISQAVRNIPYGIQQPAVSGQILALEEALHTRLFQRRPFALTPAGRRLAEFITPFFENLGEVAAELRGEAGQRLRLAASAQALRDHVPELLKILHRQQPLTRLCLQEAYQAEAEALLERHEIDLAITELAGQPAAGIKAHTLLKLPPILLIREDSPLKSARELWSAEPIRQPLIALAGNQTLTRQFHDELRRRHGRQWPVSIEASSIELVETYVAEGFGIGLSVLVPEKPARQGKSALRTLQLTGFSPLIVAALWQGNLPPVPAGFLELAKKRAAEMQKAPAARR